MRISLSYMKATLLALVLLASQAVAGGGNKEGTAAADQLLVPVGARGIALGSSYTAGLTGVEAITSTRPVSPAPIMGWRSFSRR